MKKNFSIGSLGTRMIALVVSLFLACAVFIGISSSLSLKRENLSITEEYTSQLLDQVIHNINYYTEYMEDITNVVDNDSLILSMLLLDNENSIDLAQNYQRSLWVREFLQQVSIIHKEVVDISIVGENNTISNVAGIHSLGTTYSLEQQQTNWYKETLNSSNKPLFFTLENTENSGDTASPTVISLTKAIRLHPQGNPLGVIRIDLNINVLSEICSTVRLHETGYVFLLDSNKNYLYHPDPTSKGLVSQISEEAVSAKNGFIFKENGVENYIISKELENTGWVLVGVVPYEELVSVANRNSQLYLLIGILGALLMAALLALLLSRKVFSPLNRLKTFMGEIETGNFDIILPIESNDEIGQLTSGFNTMTKKVKELMQTAIKIEEEKRQAELNALHAQINPHFLYNTMDTIVWMAEFHPHEASILAERLSKLFRLVLRNGSDIVTMGQEIKYIEIYLSIQKSRYEEKFDYTITIDPAVEKEPIPKLIVQVLVENAIYHGIKPKRQRCLLEVAAFCDKTNVIIQVKDNGVGFSQERQKEIFSSSYSPDNSIGGVGVKNVISRLQLYFGGSAQLKYESVLGEGTTATITFPRGFNFEVSKEIE